MAVHQQALKYGQRRLMRRFGRAVPWIGAAVALMTLAAAIRQKGVVRGTLDSTLNAMPVVGAIKNAAEVVRGRDFIRDKRIPT